MVTRSCRDCANYEERRDIDGISICAENIGPYVSCEEFTPKDEVLNHNKFYYRFCVECKNFEDVAGVVLCTKNHTPGKGCDLFRSRIVKLNVIRQNNHVKSVLLAHVVKKNSDFETLPVYLMEIRRKIKW
ncbi:MAG: hypothetical protein QXI71_03900 [Candidatus Bathyarchaeia archaeon]